MPYYNTSAFATLPEVAIPAKPAYFFGSLNVNTDDTYMRVSSVQLTTNVASVGGTIFRGNIPTVGGTISIQGSQSNSGLFNVKAAIITGVSGTPSTGVYTITFALTNANVGLTTDVGMALMPIPEISDTLQNGTSVAIYVPSNELRDLGQRSVTVAVTYPTLPTAATVTLYTAISNSDNPVEWTSMGVVSTVAAGAVTVPTGSSTNGGIVTFSTPAGRFFRLVVTGVTAGAGIIAKMIC